MATGKAETKRDTYTLSDSMVLQQALAALRLEFRLNFLVKVANRVEGWRGEKKNTENCNPFCFLFFFLHA